MAPDHPQPPEPPSHPDWPTLWLLAMGAGIVLVAAVGWFGTPRMAGYTLALVLAAFAVARALLPDRMLSELRIRSRVIDVSLTLGLACLVALIALVLPPS